MKNPMHRYTLAIITAMGLGLGTNHAAAAAIFPITGVSATSADTVAPADGPELVATSASLKAGPSGMLGASDSLSDSGMYDNAMDRFGDWLTPIGGSITFDLGSTYSTVNYLLIWNYNQTDFTSVGANSVSILSSTDDTTFTPVVGPNSDGSFTFTEASPAPYGSPAQDAPTGVSPQPNDGYVDAAQILPVDITNARYIELVLNSNYGYTGGLVGLNDVNFAVPEPSTFAMLGLGLLGLIAWQRKRAAF